MPDSPIEVTNDPTITSSYKIGFNWQDGVSDGGSPVVDYKITWDQSTGQWVDLTEFLVAQSFETTTEPLISGREYKLKVFARNTVGYSLASDIITILVAQIPDTPQAPTTSISNDDVLI